LTIETPTQSHINARGLIRLRWFAIAAQILTIALARLVLSLPVPLVALGVVIGIEVGVNLSAIYLVRRQSEHDTRQLGLFMAVDLIILTALLYLTGGPFNPFNFLYIVHIALAAVILEPKWTWGLGLLSTVCFGLLFLDHRALPIQHGQMQPGAMQASAFDWHVQGMWVAFVVAAITITFFVGRLARDLDQRNRQLAQARERGLRAEKLAALATLATGAAHELGTPLSTIAVVSKDLEHEAGRDQPHLAEDARLIRDQVDRCRDILDQLASDTGQTLGESVQPLVLDELLEEAMSTLDERDLLEINVDPALLGAEFMGPRRTLVHAVRALLKNALQASPPHTPVQVRVRRDDDIYRFEVVDGGAGIPAEHAPRVTEPFFTTKAPGQGMGLGLFLAQSVADTLGGTLTFTDASPTGTCATLELPLAALPRRDTAAPPRHAQGDQ
jgi:two-component system sensor histidine kinase RegB